MKEKIFEVDNFVKGNDATKHFDIYLKNLIDEAKESGDFVLTIKFKCSDDKNPNMSHMPLKIHVPIMAKYEGILEEQAPQVIITYIQNRIQEKYQELKSHYTPDLQHNFGTDFGDFKFFKELAICKGLDLDGSWENATQRYMNAYDWLVTATEKLHKNNRANKQTIQYGHQTVNLGNKSQDVYISHPIIIKDPKHYANSSVKDDSSHFEIAFIHDRILQANDMGKPIILPIAFMKENANMANPSNTYFTVMVPIAPLAREEQSEELARSTNNIQSKILMREVRSQIQEYCSYYFDNKSYAEIDNLVSFMSQLEVCQGLDVYYTERVFKKAFESLKSQDQKPSQPGE